MKLCPTCQRKFIDGQQDCPLDRTPLRDVAGAPPPGLGKELGSYRLICKLGEGGMGSIYIAAHSLLNRYVAIKVLRPELASRKELVARFFEEARTVNTIKHPNIVESIDMVEDVIDGAYIVLELLRGPDLKTRLAAGPIAIDSVLQIGWQIADALGKVHAHGIVHRDLKPDNLILINRDGRDDFVKLIDFGVAQFNRDSGEDKPFGTPAYMAPEQAAGQRVDGRADIYALGVLLFEMATGRHPFPSTSDHEYILRHADEKPARPSSIATRYLPRALDEVILKALAKRPDDRFPTAASVASALRMIDPYARSSSGSGAAKWIVGALLLGGAAAGAVYLAPRYLSSEPSQASAAPAPSPSPSPAPPAPPAPAPTPTPAADPPPPPPAAAPTVAIDIISTPAGATVYREGETIPLGVTPFTATLLRSDKKEQLRFVRAGYQPHSTDIKVDESHEVTVKLVKLPTAAPTPPPPPTPTKPKPALSREGIADPFAK